jgi:hypothetical protein
MSLRYMRPVRWNVGMAHEHTTSMALLIPPAPVKHIENSSHLPQPVDIANLVFTICVGQRRLG